MLQLFSEVYFLLLILCFGVSLAQLQYLSKADRYISALLFLTIASESVSWYFETAYHNDMVVFHVSCPIELFLICCYFGESVPVLKSKKIGPLLGVIGIVAAIGNSIFLQSYTR